jgi:hypothetical protein
MQINSQNLSDYTAYLVKLHAGINLAKGYAFNYHKLVDRIHLLVENTLYVYKVQEELILNTPSLDENLETWKEEGRLHLEIMEAQGYDRVEDYIDEKLYEFMDNSQYYFSMSRAILRSKSHFTPRFLRERAIDDLKHHRL